MNYYTHRSIITRDNVRGEYMNKSKFFTAVITIGISVAILLLIVHVIFNNNSNVNQGSFRVSDSILTSIVQLEDKSEGANEWKFDISQNNKISMLIQTVGNATIKDVYLEKVKVSSKNDVHIYIEQENYDINYKYEDIKNKKVNIYTEETEAGDFLIEFDINNQDLISNFVVPSEIKEIRHDGTILSIAKMSVAEIEFKVKYNLVLVEKQGKINRCKVELNLPNDKIITDGFSAERLDSSNFNFKVNY